MGNVRCFIGIKGKYAQAEQLGTRVLEARQRVLGGQHPDTLFALSELGLVYRREASTYRPSNSPPKF